VTESITRVNKNTKVERKKKKKRKEKSGCKSRKKTKQNKTKGHAINSEDLSNWTKQRNHLNVVNVQANSAVAACV